MLPSAEEYAVIRDSEVPLEGACAWAGVTDSLLAATREMVGHFASIRDLAGMPRQAFWKALEKEASWNGPPETDDGPPTVVKRLFTPLELSQVGALGRTARLLMSLRQEPEEGELPEGDGRDKRSERGRSRRRRRRSPSTSSSTSPPPLPPKKGAGRRGSRSRP